LFNKIPFQRTQHKFLQVSLSYQRKYDGEIVENQKVGSPVVFLWEGFWHKSIVVVCFLIKTLIKLISREIEEGRVE
jgi:hypothetical protein